MKCLILIMILGFLSFLKAQDTTVVVVEKPTRFGVGLQVGIVNSADADNAAVMGGVIVQAKFTEMVGGEISLNFRSEDYADGLVSVNSMPILISFLYYPFEPIYGIIGFGIYSVSLDYPDFTIGGTTISDETETDFDFHFGLGASFPFANIFRITAALRYHLLGYDLKAIEQVQTATEVNANYLSIMGGILFEF